MPEHEHRGQDRPDGKAPVLHPETVFGALSSPPVSVVQIRARRRQIRDDTAHPKTVPSTRVNGHTVSEFFFQVKKCGYDNIVAPNNICLYMFVVWTAILYWSHIFLWLYSILSFLSFFSTTGAFPALVRFTLFDGTEEGKRPFFSPKQNPMEFYGSN